MATVTFPKPGTSPVADQVRTMVAAGVLRGASVGFVPGLFEFSKDPARPLGIIFLDGHKLIEWSLCAVPANPRCLVVGPAQNAKSERHASVDEAEAIERRRAEARALAAETQSIASRTDKPTQTREQRIVEARNLRRIAREQ